MHVYPNFFYLINSSVDKVYHAKIKCGIANHYRKIGRKKWSKISDILKKKILRKNPKTHGFYFRKSLIGGRCLLFRCYLDMGCMGHGRKKYSKCVTKIPIFTYSTLVHLDSTSNHSKSCRELFSLHSVQF